MLNFQISPKGEVCLKHLNSPIAYFLPKDSKKGDPRLIFI